MSILSIARETFGEKHEKRVCDWNALKRVFYIKIVLLTFENRQVAKMDIFRQNKDIFVKWYKMVYKWYKKSQQETSSKNRTTVQKIASRWWSRSGIV